MKESTIIEVHRVVNNRLHQEYPLFDSADLEKCPEGHWKLWEISSILEAYEELREQKRREK